MTKQENPNSQDTHQPASAGETPAPYSYGYEWMHPAVSQYGYGYEYPPYGEAPFNAAPAADEEGGEELAQASQYPYYPPYPLYPPPYYPPYGYYPPPPPAFVPVPLPIPYPYPYHRPFYPHRRFYRHPHLWY